MKTQIWVTFQKEGFHNYPAAPEAVSYLRAVHRHIFFYKITIDVFHDDRDIEFHLFRQECIKILSETDHNFQSCEMLAQKISTYLAESYATRNHSVDVSEDNECGAIVSYEASAA